MKKNIYGSTTKTVQDGYKPSEGKLNPNNPPKVQPKPPNK